MENTEEQNNQIKEAIDCFIDLKRIEAQRLTIEVEVAKLELEVAKLELELAQENGG
jgi:hypothetical protein